MKQTLTAEEKAKKIFKSKKYIKLDNSEKLVLLNMVKKWILEEIKNIKNEKI